MSDNFNYSFIKKDDGNYHIRSEVTSFNIKQVTDKDAVAFYKQFSNYARFDTGLLPLDGTGILAIRSAGPHMQVTVQHAPDVHYINWGAYEGQSNVNTYCVAQPYRIVIGDFTEGSLLGARMFYSPYPITHPDMPLYHVNLPNINCRGYRGNAVGWICLYHNQDWSNLPFNEKISKFIERCSGVETYNDGNMSETDGPRFYESHYKQTHPDDFFDYSYLWNPSEWQSKTAIDGHHWTLNENLWIPVLVDSMDSQGAHNPQGVPLTLSMALLGNYQAYYTDKDIPKYYNIFSREDLNPSNAHISTFFKRAFALSPVLHSYGPLDSPISATSKAREQHSNATSVVPKSEPDPEYWECDSCNEDFDHSEESPNYDAYSNKVCDSCLSENYVFISSAEKYYNLEDESVYFCETSSEHFHASYDHINVCDSCGTAICFSGNYASTQLPTNVIYENEDGSKFCRHCYQHNLKTDLEITSADVSLCFCYNSIYIPKVADQIEFGVKVLEFVYPTMMENGEFSYDKKQNIICNACEHMANSMNKTTVKALSSMVVCPCGIIVPKDALVKCSLTAVVDDHGDNPVVCDVDSCCSSCIGNVKIDPETNELSGQFVPYQEEMFEASMKLGLLVNSPSVITSLPVKGTPHTMEKLMKAVISANSNIDL
jgi:hypothetical protein